MDGEGHALHRRSSRCYAAPGTPSNSVFQQISSILGFAPITIFILARLENVQVRRKESRASHVGDDTFAQALDACLSKIPESVCAARNSCHNWFLHGSLRYKSVQDYHGAEKQRSEIDRHAQV